MRNFRFWMNPVSVFIAKFLLDNWVRTEMVNAVDNCVMAYGFIVLLVTNKLCRIMKGYTTICWLLWTYFLMISIMEN